MDNPASYEAYEKVFMEMAQEEWRNVAAMPFGDVGIPDSEDEQLLIYVFPFKSEEDQPIQCFRGSKSLDTLQINDNMPKALGEEVKAIAVVNIGNDNGDARTRTGKGCRRCLEKKVNESAYTPLENDDDIVGNTSNFYAGIGPYIALKVDLESDE